MIHVSAVGIVGKKVYLAHSKGNWGPEHKGSDCLLHQFTFSPETNEFILSVPKKLVLGEEFKIVIPFASGEDTTKMAFAERIEETAKIAFAERIAKKVHVGQRFDFDTQHKNFWLLASNFPVVRPGEWNQNNVFTEMDCTNLQK